MTVDASLPVACPRCSSLLLRGASTCRVCQWDGTVTASAAVADAGRTAAEAAAPARGRSATTDRLAVASVVTTARVAGMLAWLTCVTAAVVLVLAVLAQRQLTRTFTDVINSDTGQLESSATKAIGLSALVGLASLAEVGVAIATAVLTVIWTVRARRVVLARGAYRQRYSEGWAIAGWLVPFVSLVLPFQVVTDIWHGSAPGGPGRRPTTPGLVAGWWAAFLGWSLFGLAARPHGGTVSVPLSLVSVALQCVAAFLFVNMLTAVSDRLQAEPSR